MGLPQGRAPWQGRPSDPNLAKAIPALLRKVQSSAEVKKLRDERKQKQEAVEQAAIEQQQGEAAQAVGEGEQALMAAGEEQI